MVEKKEILTHLQKHVVYPATRREIIESCNMLRIFRRLIKIGLRRICLSGIIGMLMRF